MKRKTNKRQRKSNKLRLKSNKLHRKSNKLRRKSYRIRGGANQASGTKRSHNALNPEATRKEFDAFMSDFTENQEPNQTGYESSGNESIYMTKGAVFSEYYNDLIKIFEKVVQRREKEKGWKLSEKIDLRRLSYEPKQLYIESINLFGDDTEKKEYADLEEVTMQYLPDLPELGPFTQWSLDSSTKLRETNTAKKIKTNE
jgi:hypothetical protein